MVTTKLKIGSIYKFLPINLLHTGRFLVLTRVYFETFKRISIMVNEMTIDSSIQNVRSNIQYFIISMLYYFQRESYFAEMDSEVGI